MPDYRIIMLLEPRDNNEKWHKIDELLLTRVCALKILNNIATFFFKIYCQYLNNIDVILLGYNRCACDLMNILFVRG